MGYAKLIWIYEDGIRHLERSKESLAEIGEAVLKVCMDGEKHARIRGHANCVNSCGEIHSTDEQLYLWTSNCLRPISQLSREGIDIATKLIADFGKAQEDDDQNLAATKYWKLLTSRIADVDSFGHRILFHLPSSPMTAYRWGLLSGPVSSDDLNTLLLDDNQQKRSHARDFLYSYLSDYGRIIERLGPEISENQSHLNDLALVIRSICTHNTAADDFSEILPSIASMLLDLLRSSGVREDSNENIKELNRIAMGRVIA